MERPAACCWVPSTMRSISCSVSSGASSLVHGHFNAGSELREHVAHSGLAAREVIDQIRTHGGPAQAGTVDDRFIELAGGRDAVVDHVQDLAPDRLLQPVGQMARHFAPHPQRVHADVGEKLAPPPRWWPAPSSLRRTSSTSGSRYTGLNGCATQKRSGATMSRCRSVGVSPEVLDAMITSAAA